MNAIFYNDFANAYIPNIMDEIYLRKIYDPYLMGRKDLTIVDAGANIGLWSMYAYPFAKRLIAIEPAKQHQEVLEKTFEFNKMKVEIAKYALSNENGEATFYHSPNTTAFSLSSATNIDRKDVEKVKTITIADLFKMYKLDYVDVFKMDIEGAEAQVFGSQAFDEVKDKVGVFLGEFHVWSGLNPKQFETYFIDRGFNFHWTNQTEASTFIAEHI